MSESTAAGRMALPLGSTSAREVLRYLLWRVLGAIVVVFVVLTLVFIAVEVLPGSPRFLLPRGGMCVVPPGGGPCVDLGQQLVAQWGLDKPLLERYGIFLTNVLTGNLGISTTFRPTVPVASIIGPVVPTTLAILAVTLLLLALFSLPLGMRMSRRSGGVLDLTATLWLSFPVAFSAVFLNLLGLYSFGFVLKLIPLTLVSPASGTPSLANLVAYLAFPILVVVGSFLGLFTWLVRDHPLRPAADLAPRPPGEWRSPKTPLPRRVADAIPRFLGAMPALVPWVVGGEFLAEGLLNVNGLGLLFWTAVLRSDSYLVMGVVVTTALLIILPILVAADVLHHVWTGRWERLDAVRADSLRVTFRHTWQRFRGMLLGGLGPVGMALIVTVGLIIVLGPMLVGPYPTYFSLDRPFLPPSTAHPLGTDEAGQDILKLLAYGGQELPGIAILAFEGAVLAGLFVVGLIGFIGERATPWIAVPVDALLVLSVPFALLLGLLAVPDAVVWGSVLVAAPIGARILMLDISGMVRSASMPDGSRFSVRARAARSMNLLRGTGPLLLGNAFVAVSLAVLVWAAFGFLGLGTGGLGVRLSWGQIVNNAFNYLAMLRGQWWYFVPPIYLIFLAALGPLLLGVALKGMTRPEDGTPTATPAPAPISDVPTSPQAHAD